MPSYDHVALAVGLTVALMIGAIAGAGIGYITGLQNAQAFELMKDAAPTKIDPLALSIAYDTEHLMVNTTPTPEPKYVTCSDYVKITDRYKTPDGFYVVAKNETIVLPEVEYNKAEKGYYAKVNKAGVYGRYYQGYTGIEGATPKLTPVSEAESGYRDACEVMK